MEGNSTQHMVITTDWQVTGWVWGYTGFIKLYKYVLFCINNLLCSCRRLHEPPSRAELSWEFVLCRLDLTGDSRLSQCTI